MSPIRASDSSRDLPRERLRHLGPRALSVPELLALMIGSGSGAAPAHEVAGRIWVAADRSLRRLATVDVALWEDVPGVGRAMSSRLVAGVELGRRAAVDDGPAGAAIRGPADVFRRFGPRLRDLSQEEFHVILLDTRHCVLREVLVTRGILDASLIHPREVFRPAIAEGAAGIVLLHNHPSGDPTPSAEDRAVTRQLVEAGRTLGIPVLDHVVVGRGRYRSALDEGGPGTCGSPAQPQSKP